MGFRYLLVLVLVLVLALALALALAVAVAVAVLVLVCLGVTNRTRVGAVDALVSAGHLKFLGFDSIQFRLKSFAYLLRFILWLLCLFR
jgi:hypothetical protein